VRAKYRGTLVLTEGCAVRMGIESVEPADAACRLRVVCAVDYRLRRIPDMDASPHGVTN
jgi:hypothetical protein